MSLLASVTTSTVDNKDYKFYFALAEQAGSNWSKYPALTTVNLSGNNIINGGNVILSGSTLSGVSLLDLDGQVLTADDQDLFLNGVAIATICALPNLAEWASYPADSNVELNNVGISGQPFSVIGAKTYTFSDSSVLSVNASSLLFNGTPIGGLSGGVNQWSRYPAVSSINANGYNLGNVLGLNCSNLTADTSITSPLGHITNVNTCNIYSSTNQPINMTSDTAMNLISTSNNVNIKAGFSNSLYQQVNISAGQFNLVADQGYAVPTYSDINITAQNGNRGRVNITANGGFSNGVYGEVNIVANGSSLSNVGSGGLITLTANTPSGFSNATSAIKLSSAGINIYAGYRGSIGSLEGYLFNYATLGINIVASLLAPIIPNVPGTVYLYGDTGIEMGSSVYVSQLYPYWNGIGSVGNLYITSRTVGLSTGYIVLQGVSNVTMAGDASITSVATITGGGSGASLSNIKTIQGSNITISNVSNITGTTGNFSNITSSNATISNTASIGTLNTSSINGNTLLIGGSSITLNSGSGATKIQGAECDILSSNTYISSNCYTDNLYSSNTTISNVLNTVAISNVLYPSKRLNDTFGITSLTGTPIILYESPSLTWNYNNVPSITSVISLTVGVDTATSYAFSAQLLVGSTTYPFQTYTLSAPFVASSGAYNGVNIVSATLGDSFTNVLSNGASYKVLVYMAVGGASTANTTGGKISVNFTSAQNL